MKHNRAWRRRVLCLCTGVATVALAFATAASAATPPAETVSSSNPTATFSGQLTMPNFLPPQPNGSPCPDQATDPGDVVCGHNTVTTAQAGTVTTCVSFSAPGDPFGMTDLDLFVVDRTATSTTNGQIIASSTSQQNPECVTFNTVAGGSYEIQINPSFLIGPTTFNGTITFQAANGGVAGGPTGNNGGGVGSGQKMTGGGKTTDAGQYSINAFQSDPSKGKVQFSNGACSIKSSGFTTIAMSPSANGGQLDATGPGQANGRNAQFHVHAEDHGEPSTNDVFTITATDPTSGAIICQGGGQVQNGNLQYHGA